MTLQRVLEPEYMDTAEEAQDYDEMDHGGVNQIFVDDLLATGHELGDVLDVGTGTAQIPVALCERESECRVMAVDAATHMLDVAVYNLEAASLTHRIQLAHCDCKQLYFDAEMFDTVISNSIIHHIPEPIEVLKEAVRVCKTGGILFFRDLLRPESDAEVNRIVKAYAGDENDHQQQMFDDSLRAALTVVEVQELVESLGFDRSEVKQTTDRHWTWIAEKK